MPHFGHVLVLAIVEVMGAVIGVLAINSRSGFGRRVTYSRVAGVVTGVGADVHSVAEIDPDDARNMSILVAFE